jgi:hypothetical protein
MKLPSLPQCFQAARGNSDAAMLLYKICYWAVRATVPIDGKTWIAKDRATWMRELGGLSFGRFRRALDLLRRLGLVETRQAHFGSDNRNITHLRLVWNAHLEPEMLDRGYAAVPPDWYTHVPLLSKSNTPIEIQRKNKNCVLPHAGPKASEDRQEGLPIVFPENVAPTPPTPAPPSVEEIAVTARAQSDSNEITPAPAKKKAQPVWLLSLQWKNTVSQVHGAFVPDLTAKQRGQLGQLIKKVPPDTAGDVLDACICDWVGFVTRAKADAGAFNLPSKPDIGFLLRYVGVAVNFAQAVKAAPKLTKPAHAITKPPVPAMEASPSPKPGADKATLAEVLAILEEVT